MRLCKHSWQYNTDCVRTDKINRKVRLKKLKEERHRRVGSLHSTAATFMSSSAEMESK
jgi:hypothetical protein